MSIRTSIILVIALVMVSGYVVFVQLAPTTETVDQPPWFYNVDESDMTRISVTDRGEEAVFFLGEDERWHMGDPEGLPAGLDRWGGVTLLLSGPKSRRLLEVQPTDLEPYGLDSPPIRIDVDLRDGRTISVLLGYLTPDAVGIYGQVEGFPQVFTIVAGWGQVLTRLVSEPPYPEWYYNVDRTILTDIQLQTPEKTIALVKNVAGWRFDDADQSPVDEAQIPTLFDALEQPTQALVEYRAADLVQYGLDQPSLSLFLRTVRVRLGSVDITSEFLFHIGNPTEDGTGYYVLAERDEGVPDVFKVNADWVERLQAIVADPPFISGVAQGS